MVGRNHGELGDGREGIGRRLRSEVQAFLQVVKEVEDVRYNDDLLPCLQFLDNVLAAGDDAYHCGFPEACKQLRIAKLRYVVFRAQELSGGAAIMSNNGSVITLNPVALAMLAQNGISVSIHHDCQDFMEAPEDYTPHVRYITKNFVI